MPLVKNSNEDKKRRDKDKDRDKDRERRKERPKDDEERKHRRRKDDDVERKDRDREKRDRDKDHEKKERRHRDKENGEVKDDDRERRRRKHREDGESSASKSKKPNAAPKDEIDGDERKHKRKEGREKDNDREHRRRKPREEGEDDDDERRKRREERRKQNGEGKERRRPRDDEDREKRHKDRDEERRRHRGEDDEERQRRHHREDANVDGQRHQDDRDRDKEKINQDQPRKDEDEKPRRHKDKSDGKEKEKEEKKSAPKTEDDDEYNYDDDDFEDYEEDFEEDDSGSDEHQEQEKDNEINGKETVQHKGKSREEMDDILKAMDAENNRLLNESREGDRDQDSDNRRSSKRPAAGKRCFINFVSAKQRQANSKSSLRAKTRGRELLKIIELDRVAFDIFDMPPVSEYELYMRTFGRSDTRQRYIQTNEENLDKDIQTEEIETVEKWVQWPPEDTKGCGGDKETEEEEASKPIDTVALTKFVQSAGQAILILLEEDRVEAHQSDSSRKRSNICLSEAFLEIEAPPILKGRCVSCTHFSEAQTNMLLTVHDKPETHFPEDKLYSKGSICVWNVNEPSHPQKVLVCEGQPQCCCFSPVKATLVFAGMVDGSVVVWDLRESNSLHKQHYEGDESWFLRYPTYNTAGVLHYENHQSVVTSIVPIYVPGDAGDSDVEGSTSFQLATVEENATIHLWVVAEIAHPDLAGSESDLGLSPGGRIKLIKSSVIVLNNPIRDTRFRTTMKAFEMKLLPADPSHFYVGTDTGYIIHGVRFGGKAPPKAYKPDIDAPLEVTSIDFSPFTEPVFLAGCADGSVRLYHINNAAPMMVWESTTGGQPVLAVRWCQSRPSVFFVVDTVSRLYIWDLLMSDVVPMKEEVISKDRLTSFCLSNDYAATGMGVAGRKAAMVVVSFETGRVEVHTMSQQFSALMPEEVDQFAQFLGHST